jgi:hypothetical protein
VLPASAELLLLNEKFHYHKVDKSNHVLIYPACILGKIPELNHHSSTRISITKLGVSFKGIHTPIHLGRVALTLLQGVETHNQQDRPKSMWSTTSKVRRTRDDQEVDEQDDSLYA